MIELFTVQETCIIYLHAMHVHLIILVASYVMNRRDYAV